MSKGNNSSKQNIISIKNESKTTKNYNMNSTNNAPKNRQQLNDITKFINLKDLNFDERKLYLGRQVYLWDMFGQKAKSVLILHIGIDDTIIYEIKGKVISNETHYKNCTFCASYTHIDNKTLNLGVNIAGGCFYGKILSQSEKDEIEEKIKETERIDRENEEKFEKWKMEQDKLLNDTKKQTDEKVKMPEIISGINGGMKPDLFFNF